MIISRTPFRVSFFGGGTDYPAWYHEHGGAVLATTINKYCYITVRHLPPFFDHKSRIVWSHVEAVKEISEIQHPAVREALSFLDIRDGVEIEIDAATTRAATAAATRSVAANRCLIGNLLTGSASSQACDTESVPRTECI